MDPKAWSLGPTLERVRTPLSLSLKGAPLSPLTYLCRNNSAVGAHLTKHDSLLGTRGRASAQTRVSERSLDPAPEAAHLRGLGYQAPNLVQYRGRAGATDRLLV